MMEGLLQLHREMEVRVLPAGDHQHSERSHLGILTHHRTGGSKRIRPAVVFRPPPRRRQQPQSDALHLYTASGEA
jgi:hypothetical protein